MDSRFGPVRSGATLLLALTCLIPSAVEAQGRGNGGRSAPAATTGSWEGVTLSVAVRTQIQEFYASHHAHDVEALPPGIRRNLARGKPLPPGIARKAPPADLRTRVHLHEGYELVEVGLDVFLVEVATGIVHDVLMDVIR